MDIRQTIKDEMERQGISAYQLAILAEQAEVCQRETIYRYLRGEVDAQHREVPGSRDVSGQIVGGLLELIDVQLVPNNQQRRVAHEKYVRVFVKPSKPIVKRPGHKPNARTRNGLKAMPARTRERFRELASAS